MTTPAPSSSPSSSPPPSVESPAARLLRLNWQSTLKRDAAGVPRLPPSFVAEQGQLVRILDVRDEADLVGALGHIPAVTHVSMERLGEVPRVLSAQTFVVLVSRHGDRAGVAARYLESLGMQRVAAMDGGMTAWKSLGFTCLRDDKSYRKELYVLAPGMGRDGRPLAVTHERGALTREEIEGHIGEATAVRWVKLAAFLLHGKRSCVDGRDDHGVIGTPGGDAGELLLALAAAERVTGRAIEKREVARVLERHVDTFGRFYMHTDTHAMNRLIVDGFRKDDRIVPFLGATFEAQEWRAWIASPPPGARKFVLEHLVKPENMGCGHLRFCMTEQSAYGVRAALARDFIEAFHELRWAGAPELEWTVLGGEHVEGAVANVIVEGGLHTYTKVPLVSPMVAGQQMFVNHPQVTSFMRRELAACLAENDLCARDASTRLYEEIEAIGGAQAGHTLGKLAKGLPLFQLAFPVEGAPSVTEAGHIG